MSKCFLFVSNMLRLEGGQVSDQMNKLVYNSLLQTFRGNFTSLTTESVRLMKVFKAALWFNLMLVLQKWSNVADMNIIKHGDLVIRYLAAASY